MQNKKLNENKNRQGGKYFFRALCTVLCVQRATSWDLDVTVYCCLCSGTAKGNVHNSDKGLPFRHKFLAGISK